MVNKIIIILFIVLHSLFSVAQQSPASAIDQNHGLVKWLTFKEAFELNKKNPKPFIIDVYTEWCGWCKHMIKTTYSNQGIASYINNFFYPVQFDAETKDTIEYMGKKYWNESTRPKSAHQLAIKLMGDRLSYPTTIFLMNNLQTSMLSAGYMDVKQIEPILVYCVENIWRSCTFDDFKLNFSKTFNDSISIQSSYKPISFKEFEQLKPKKKKKTIIVAYTSWCNGCKILNKTTFTDTLIAPYLKENYNVIDFNIETGSDSVFWNGKYYKASGKYGTFNDLVVEISGGQVGLPSILILDEQNKLIDRIPFYIPAQTLNPILHFYAENAYLKTKWPEYQEAYKKRK
jgi:thioredoxin-related protein